MRATRAHLETLIAFDHAGGVISGVVRDHLHESDIAGSDREYGWQHLAEETPVDRGRVSLREVRGRPRVPARVASAARVPSDGQPKPHWERYRIRFTLSSCSAASAAPIAAATAAARAARAVVMGAIVACTCEGGNAANAQTAACGDVPRCAALCSSTRTQ